MKKLLAGLLTLGLTITSLSAQELSLKGDGVRVVKIDRVVIVKEDATVVQAFPVTVNAPTGAGLYFWSFPVGVVAADKGDVLEIATAPKGPITISVKAISADLDKDGKFKGFVTKFHSLTFTVGDIPAPGPGPGPAPPDPVTPAPIALPGFRVLFIEEQADRQKLTLDQFNAMRGAASVAWLNANTEKEGNQPGWRVADKDAELASEPGQHWRDALKRRPEGFSVPWVVISNGVTGYEGPLPKTKTEIDTLLRKYLVQHLFKTYK